MCKERKWFRLSMVASVLGASSLCWAALPTHAADGEAVAAPADQPAVTPAVVAEAVPADVQPGELATREELQRKEARLMAEQFAAQGFQAFQKREYRDALDLYTKAEERWAKISKSDSLVLKRIADIRERKANINAVFAEALADEGRNSAKADKFDEAIIHCRTAYTLDPQLKDEMQSLIEEFTADKKKAEFKGAVAPENVDSEKATRDTSLNTLLEQGKVMMANKRYTDARNYYERVLVKDPTNLRATHGIHQIDKALLEVAKIRRAATETQRLAAMEWIWAEPVNPANAADSKEDGSRAVSKTESSGTGLRARLHTIVLPKIEFEDATISQVIQFLKKRSMELDPDGQGVNIVLYVPANASARGAGPAAMPDATVTPPVDGVAVDAAAGPAPDAAAGATAGTAVGSRTVTISMNNVPLDDAIHYICMSAGLKFRVDRTAVLIASAGDEIDEMETAFYAVPPAALGSLGSGVKAVSATTMGPASVTAPADAAPTGEPTAPENLKKSFESYGVAFPPGSGIAYNAAISKLIVRNTTENLQKIKIVLDEINVDTEQVTIEAKFMEVGVNDLEEFGFDWMISTGTNIHNSVYNQTWSSPVGTQQRTINTIGTEAGVNAYGDPTGTTYTMKDLPAAANASTRLGQGLRDATTGLGLASNLSDSLLGVKSILGNYQIDTILRALQQSQTTNMLASPKVTAMSGNEAVLEMVTKRYFPTEWEPPRVNNVAVGAAGAGGGVETVPSAPRFGDPTNIGVILRVTPQVRDKFVINLKLTPEVTAFIGYDTELNQMGTLGGQPFNYKYQMPIIESRKVETQVEIYDGETLVLGGFIKEDTTKYTDKVPYLADIPIIGFLFQTKGSKNVKRDLLIFVTARLVKPSGIPVRTNDRSGIPRLRN